ncbi:hypothetical protein B0H19DRAFT_1272722 [Mycena capillaripes]|nr:hypothetical protein B0H19DRAFT_1272722 [Mycena capillaripes]
MLFASITVPFLAFSCFYPAAVHSAPVARQAGTQLCTETDGSGFCSGFLAGQCFNLGGGGQFSFVSDLTGCKRFPTPPPRPDLSRGAWNETSGMVFSLVHRPLSPFNRLFPHPRGTRGRCCGSGVQGGSGRVREVDGASLPSLEHTRTSQPPSLPFLVGRKLSLRALSLLPPVPTDVNPHSGHMQHTTSSRRSYVSMGNRNKLLDALPDLLACKNRLSDAIAEAHIVDFVTLTLHLTLTEHSPFLPAIDEKHFVPAQLAVTDLKEAQSQGAAVYGAEWLRVLAAWLHVLAAAATKLDGALVISGKSDIGVSSQLDSRIALLRDEIAKRIMIEEGQA